MSFQTRPEDIHVRCGGNVFTVQADCKGKDPVLIIALLTRVRLASRRDLQSRKWQLIGMSNV